MLSLYEQLVGGGQVTAKEKSILGRCTELVYQPYIRNGYQGTPPTLRDFYRLLKLQPEPEAQGPGAGQRTVHYGYAEHLCQVHQRRYPSPHHRL